MRHPNSAESLKTVDRQSRYAKILDVFKKAPHCLTDRQVAQFLGYNDMNSVRPRITELISAGCLTEGVSVQDELTGKRVRTTVFIRDIERETRPYTAKEESLQEFRRRHEKPVAESMLF